MSCSAEQIAEKKRLALERLRANQTTTIASSSTSSKIAENKQIALERLASKKAASGQQADGTANAQSPQQSKAQIIADNKQLARERLRATQNLLALSNKTGSENNSASKFLSSNSFDAGKSKTAFQGRPKPYDNRNRPSGSGAIKTQPQQLPPVAAIFHKTVTCSCSLISTSKFMVKTQGYFAPLIDTFKLIASRSYNIESKQWTFHVDDYALVQERVQSLMPDVSISPLPRFLLNLLNTEKHKSLVATDASCLASLEPKLLNALLPFQRSGVLFGIQKQGRCMIADEMGLGKTYQALALADFYKHDWPLLVCTTAATRDSWASKIRELLPYVPTSQIVCMVSQLEEISDAKVLVVSYNLMERHLEKLRKRQFKFVIFDESHLLKNIKAKSTTAAIELTKHAKRVVLLTGTPALSRPSELYTQLQIIDPSFFGFKEYSSRYCDGKQSNFGWDSSGQSNLSELNVVLGSKFMIRRTKQEVMFDMGAKSRETVMLDPTLIWKEGETSENLQSYGNDFASLKGRDREDVLMKYYNETAHAKATAVGAYLKELIREDRKFIVFAHHRVMLDAISECMRSLKVDHVRIDGTTKNEQRTIFVDRFQQKSECRVAVLSLKACNAGITLTAAQLVLFAELDWNPSTMAQAESRAHRIGQTGDVTCRYLLAKGTADDVIWEMLKTKQETLNKAGLFHEDLADGAVTNAPNSNKSINDFFSSAPQERAEPDESNALDLSAFLDGDDEDFASIPC